MLNRYRGIISAIAGLILIGAGQPNKQPATTEQPNAKTNQTNATPPIAVGTPASQPKDGGCGAGHDDRQSDLCAQWKAADAASDAAKWNWWQMIAGFFGLLVGAGTLFFAARAAHWAKEAASHTQTGANEAKRSADAAENAIIESQRIGEAQTRCYLTGIAMTIIFHDDGVVGVHGMIKNTGQSPADDIIFMPSLALMVKESDKVWKFDPIKNTHLLAEHYSIGSSNEEKVGPVKFDVNFLDLDIGDGTKILIQVKFGAVGKDVFGKNIVIDEVFYAYENMPFGLPSVFELKRGGKMQPRKIEDTARN